MTWLTRPRLTCVDKFTSTEWKISGRSLKRSLKGTYVAVEPFHLSRYVDEQVFRYNHRKEGDRKLTNADRLAMLMSQVVGHRLTYSELTGKSDSPHHETTGTGEADQVPF